MLRGPTICKIVAVHSGKVLDVWKHGRTKSYPIVQHAYLGGDNQHWILTPVFPDSMNTTFTMQSFESKLFLEGIHTSNIGDDLSIALRHSSEKEEQTWQFIPARNTNGDRFSIVNSKTRKALGVQADSTKDGAPVVQYAYDSAGIHQYWQLILVFPQQEWPLEWLEDLIDREEDSQ